MSRKAPGFDFKSPSTRIVCLDIAAVVCALVVAGRPDGMAITLTAVIVTVGILIYRRSLGVKADLAEKARQRLAREAARKAPAAAPAVPADAGAKGNSWLRGGD